MDMMDIQENRGKWSSAIKCWSTLSPHLFARFAVFTACWLLKTAKIWPIGPFGRSPGTKAKKIGPTALCSFAGTWYTYNYLEMVGLGDMFATALQSWCFPSFCQVSICFNTSSRIFWSNAVSRAGAAKVSDRAQLRLFVLEGRILKVRDGKGQKPWVSRTKPLNRWVSLDVKTGEFTCESSIIPNQLVWHVLTCF